MKKHFEITIPKPCHENWQTMTPNQKGRFCNSCSKTVVDFTLMNATEVQNYLSKNQDERICGHIKQSQLNSINHRIPSEILQKKMSYKRFFSLALLIVMGSSIISCTGQNGKVRKIDSIEIIDSTYRKIDTSYAKKKATNNEVSIEDVMLEGEMITGDIIYQKDFYKTPMPFNIVDIHPQFINTPKHLTSEEKKKLFNKKISAVFNEKLKQIAKHHKRVNIMFEIDSLGYTQNIKTRPRAYEKDINRILNSLPQFIPAKHKGTNVSVSFALPILFKEQ